MAKKTKKKVEVKKENKIYFSPTTKNKTRVIVKNRHRIKVVVRGFRKAKDYFWVAFYYINGLIFVLSMWYVIFRLLGVLFNSLGIK